MSMVNNMSSRLILAVVTALVLAPGIASADTAVAVFTILGTHNSTFPHMDSYGLVTLTLNADRSVGLAVEAAPDPDGGYLRFGGAKVFGFNVDGQLGRAGIALEIFTNGAWQNIPYTYNPSGTANDFKWIFASTSTMDGFGTFDVVIGYDDPDDVDGHSLNLRVNRAGGFSSVWDVIEPSRGTATVGHVDFAAHMYGCDGWVGGNAPPVPEPGTMGLLGGALLAGAVWMRRRRG